MRRFFARIQPSVQLDWIIVFPTIKHQIFLSKLIKNDFGVY